MMLVRLVCILLLFLAATGALIYLLVLYPYYTGPPTFLLLILFYLYKNRSAEHEETITRDFHILDYFPNQEAFSVMSFNVMADNVTFKILYRNCSFPHLNFLKYRGPRMIKEIQQNLPSIILMQEIDHYTDFWRPELEKIGYETFLNKRAKLFRHGALAGF